MGRKSKKTAEVAAPATTETNAIDAAVTAVATEVATGKPVGEGETFSLDQSTTQPAHAPVGIPADLPTQWVDPNIVFVEDDARTVAAHNQFEIDRDFAVNIFIYGQKQPAVAYAGDIDDRLILVTGHTRRRAVKLINDGFEATDPRTGELVKFHDPDRKLWVAVDKSKTKEDAFVDGLITNIKANALTPVQEAYAVKRLTERHQWSLTDAAKLFGYNNTNRQNKLLRLLELEQAVIEKVHSGDLSVDAAVATESLKPEQRLAIIEKASDDSGKVDGGLIKELLRNIYSQGDEAVKAATNTGKSEEEGGEKKSAGGKKKSDEDEGPAKGVSLARNASKFKTFAEGIINDEDSEFGQPVKDLLGRMLEWFAGKKGDTSLKNALRDNVKGK